MTVNPFTFGNPILNPSDSQRLVIAFSGEGIEISTVGCQSALFSNAGTASPMINPVALAPNKPDAIYAATPYGIFRLASK